MLSAILFLISEFKDPVFGTDCDYPKQTLTLNLLTTTIVAPPSNASKWQMGFNSAFNLKG